MTGYSEVIRLEGKRAKRKLSHYLRLTLQDTADSINLHRAETDSHLAVPPRGGELL